MPPKRDPPTLEESMAILTENVNRLVLSSTANTEKILSAHSSSQSQLDIIVQQLATQYEQNSTLLATLIKTEASSSQPKTPPPLPSFDTTIRPPKINLPTFDGSNPLDWLFQADQYFAFYHIKPPERLTMVSFYLSGDALSWYKYLYNNNLLTTWRDFTRALETRFGPSSYDNHQAALFKLRQTSTVTAYKTEFERLSNCVVGLPEEARLSCFVSGLRRDIQQELSILRPLSITQTIGLAKLIEDKVNDQRYRSRFFTSPRTQNPSISTTNPTPTSPPTLTSNQQPPLLPTPTSSPPNLPFTRLSPDALQKRRAAGFCFRCPEKYHPGHKTLHPQTHDYKTYSHITNTYLSHLPLFPHHAHMTTIFPSNPTLPQSTSDPTDTRTTKRKS